eukprot:SAG25_NODE_849_length_5079_cov_19.384739_4_plen_131_part_00
MGKKKHPQLVVEDLQNQHLAVSPAGVRTRGGKHRDGDGQNVRPALWGGHELRETEVQRVRNSKGSVREVWIARPRQRIDALAARSLRTPVICAEAHVTLQTVARTVHLVAIVRTTPVAERSRVPLPVKAG